MLLFSVLISAMAATAANDHARLHEKLTSLYAYHERVERHLDRSDLSLAELAHMTNVGGPCRSFEFG